jgi:hypothetical membrane protein
MIPRHGSAEKMQYKWDLGDQQAPRWTVLYNYSIIRRSLLCILVSFISTLITLTLQDLFHAQIDT